MQEDGKSSLPHLVLGNRIARFDDSLQSHGIIMIEEFLNRIFVNQTAVLVIVGVLLLGLAELGYRLGVVTHRRDSDAAKGHGGSIQGAVLGLLGLLLGFTFAMSVDRFDTRRQIIVDEANAIGTTWLRAEFLAEHERDAIRELLVEYTKLHLEQFRHDTATEDFKRVRVRIGELLNEIWQIGSMGARQNNTPLTSSFIVALNETIDLDASRVAARENHVPGAVWLLLLIVASCGAWSSGFVSGANGARSFFNQQVFPLLITVVIMMISDIDRPRRGIINVSQQPLMDLLETMKKPVP